MYPLSFDRRVEAEGFLPSSRYFFADVVASSAPHRSFLRPRRLLEKLRQAGQKRSQIKARQRSSYDKRVRARSQLYRSRFLQVRFARVAHLCTFSIRIPTLVAFESNLKTTKIASTKHHPGSEALMEERKKVQRAPCAGCANENCTDFKNESLRCTSPNGKYVQLFEVF